MRVDRLLRNLMFVFVAICFAQEVRAVDPNRTISQYRRESWGLERGFMGGAVSSIAQTADGYLWIGTAKGLIRFEGMSFRLYQQSPTSIPIGPVQGLVADSQSNLWILLENTKILRYHDGKFDPGRNEAEVGITSLGRGRDGSALFSSLTLGPLSYGAGNFKVLMTPEASSGAATTSVTDDELSSHLSWATGVATHRLAKPSSAVVAVAETTDGLVWLGTSDRGLFYLKGGRVYHVPQGVDDGRINCLLPMETGELWIGTDKGVLRWTGSKLTREGLPSEVQNTQILSAIRDRDGNIWLGSGRGLLRFNSHGVSYDDGATAQSGLAVNSLFEDREGDIWIGTTQGIERLRDSPFVSYAIAKGSPQESGGPVYVDGEGRTWFAALDGGLHWLKDGHIESVSAAGLDKDVVYSITGSGDEVWVGRQRGGLTQLRFRNGGLETRRYLSAISVALKRNSGGAQRRTAFAV